MSVDVTTMTQTEFAQYMVNKYRLALADNAGMTSIALDGQTVAYADIENRYDYWQAKLGRLNGSRPPLVGVDLRNCF